MEWLATKSEDIREWGYRVSVFSLGASLSSLTILYFVRGTRGGSLALLKLLIPLFLSLGITTLGLGLLREAVDSVRVLTVGLSGVLGAILMGVVTLWIFTIQQLEGTSTGQSQYLVLSNLSIGVLIGTVLGIYRVRLQHRSDQLAREVNRLNEFAGIVAHDLRNPLHIAQGYLGELPREGHEEQLATIERAHGRMERLIDHVLALSQRGEAVGEPEFVDVGTVAESAWTDVPTDEAELQIPTDRDLQADERRFRSLFENLFRNAVEHGSTSNPPEADDAVEHGGDSVTVTVGSLQGGFYVADDGEGIPPEQQERIFEGGFSTDDGGTGLGLAIVRQIANAHDWTIRVTESASGGARFEFHTG